MNEPEEIVDEAAESMPGFETFGLRAETLSALQTLGWIRPTPVQSATLEPMMAGLDLIVQSPTGTGKTGAFGVPLVDRLVRTGGHLQALILAPTRELALQSAHLLGPLGAPSGIRTLAVYGGAPMEAQIRQLREGVQIVSGTPGRVLDHLRRGTLDPSAMRVLVLDEADEILSMGFAQELQSILECLPARKQTVLFSATLSKETERLIQGHLRDPQFITLSGSSVAAKSIRHVVYMVSGKGRGRDLLRILSVERPEHAIIFCNTKAETQSVAEELQKAGLSADWLNSDLSQAERERTLTRIRRGELRFLVATDVAARGLDVSLLSHVINYTFPESAEQYVHRTGRTGRAGRSGTAISLIAPPELASLYYLRLQYRIFPIERSLPTAIEARTRIEIDRIAFLEERFRGAAAEPDRALAKRLLTHPDAERLVAWLLRVYFDGQKTTTAEEVLPERRKRRRPRARRHRDASAADTKAHAPSGTLP